MTPKRLLVLAFAFVGPLVLGAVSAKASIFDFTYSGTSLALGGAAVSGSGEFVTDNGPVPYNVISVTGTANGEAITGLSTYAFADNKLWYPASLTSVDGGFSTPPTWLSISGISFTTASNTWNIGNYGGYYLLDANSDPSGVLSGAVPGFNFSITEETSTTPLPAALPLFAGGLGLMGLLARRKKRKSSAATAAA
jgi:hypothetical protein